MGLRIQRKRPPVTSAVRSGSIPMRKELPISHCARAMNAIDAAASPIPLPTSAAGAGHAPTASGPPAV